MLNLENVYVSFILIAFESNEYRIVRCESITDHYQACPVDNIKKVIGLELISTKSSPKSLCTRDVSYGFSEKAIWVTNGCRAQFKVLFDPGTYCIDIHRLDPSITVVI